MPLQTQRDLDINTHANNHAACDPDRCFTAKLRYWRSRGAPPVHAPDGFWNSPSKYALERQEVDAARANGRVIERAPQ